MLNKTLLRGSDEQPYEIHVVGDKRNAYAVANSERLSLMTVVYEDKTPFAGFYLERDATHIVLNDPAPGIWVLVSDNSS